MAVSCVQHYSKHFIKILEKSLEPFFRQKICQKMAKNYDFGKIINFMEKESLNAFSNIFIKCIEYWSLIGP